MEKEKLPSVEERNARFEVMTPAERRVKLAQEVVDMIDREELVGLHAGYLSIRSPEMENLYAYNVREIGLQRALDEAPKCVACGIGAGVVAAARVFDRIEGRVQDQYDHYGMRAYLEDFFTMEEIGKIECCFEQTTGHRDQPKWATPNGEVTIFQLDMREAEAAAAYGRSIERPNARLRAIYQNVIDNDGRFVVPAEFYDLPDEDAHEDEEDWDD